MDRDAEHLKLLSIFHYVLAAFMALGGLTPLIHITLGILMLTGVIAGNDHDARPIGLVIVFFGLGLMVLLWAFAVVTFLAGRALATRTRRTFCMVVAGINCLNAPFGTVLGVFTILVLSRPSVQELFQSTAGT